MKRLLKWLFKIVAMLVLAGLVVVLMLYLDGVFNKKVAPQTPTGPGSAAVGSASLVEATFIAIPNFEQAPGTIQPLHENALASKVREPEKVIEVNVIAGQAVHKGDLLVKLDSSTWQNRKEMAEAKLKIAQSTRDDAQRNFDRMKEAFDKKVATQTELDTTKYHLEEALSEVVAAQRAVDETVMNLDYTQIRAPMDAVVIDKRVDVGDTVAPGQVLVSLYDKMQLIANVREGLMKHLKTGQNIGVYIDDIGAGCEGAISEIVPQADPATRTFLVKVMGSCHAGVRPGMYAKLLIPLGDRKVLVIPPGAIMQVGQLTMVDVAGSGGLDRRNVQLGKPVDFEGTSPENDQYMLRRVAEEMVARMATVKDTSRAYIVGGQPRKVQVYLDRERMRGYNVAPLEIQRAIAGANIKLTAGEFTRSDAAFTVEAGRVFNSPDDLHQLVVGVFNNAPVFLKDVANIVDGPDEVSSYVRHGWGMAKGFSDRPGTTGSLIGAPAFTVNDLLTIVRRQVGQQFAGKNVAAVGPLIPHDAVEQQVIRRPSAGAQQRRFLAVGRLGRRLTCFGEEDMSGKVGKLDLTANLPVFVEKRFSENAVAEPTPETGNLLLRPFARLVLVPLDGATQALRRNLGANVLFHFHQQEAAILMVLGVKIKDGMPGGSSSGE
jgi:RND family efflux transporter MFP subunit